MARLYNPGHYAATFIWPKIIMSVKISILMSIKNEASYISKCIQSVLSQTENDFELIIVDDHSTDDTKLIINQYLKKDSRIQLYTNPGKGIIDALIFAYKKSKGRYLTRQDGDDLMPRDKLANLFSLLNKYDKNTIATGKCKYFAKGSLGNGFIKYEKWINLMCENNNHYDYIFKECVLVSSNWLMCREAFEDIGGFDGLYYPEDYYFAFKLFKNNTKIVSTKQITHLWRDHPKRASRTLEHYKDQKFFVLKVDFFTRIYGNQRIGLWGAGPTGKKLARILLEKSINFEWYTNNLNKIGKDIYGVKIKDYKTLVNKSGMNIIVSVTQRDALNDIVVFVNSIEGLRYFEF